jgi:signal transduction histidine kinase
MAIDSLSGAPSRFTAQTTAEEATANIHASAWTRVVFAGIMALLSLALLPLWEPLTWFAVISVWELGLRPVLHRTFALPAAARSQEAGFLWLAAVNFVGTTLYLFCAAALWMAGGPAGMVLATAWVCGSANHLFVYCSANRWLLLSGIAPLAAMALATPLMSTGLSVESAIAITALGVLMIAAGMYGFDRRRLLSNLASQAVARESAERANTAKSQFLATMSHELRTPLNAVIGYAELIEEEAGRGPVADDASKIRGSARQLLGVIDVILDISRLETGAVELQCERGAIAAVVQQVREAALPLATANNNTVHIDVTGDLGDAEIDHARLHQALMQLVSNASKFTHDGEIRIGARREVLGKHERLVFSVSDTGAGIASEDQARIFEPFVQGDSGAARRAEGTGLGLTLVRRLARLMGGDVRCESTLGCGSTFTLWIDAGPPN